MKLNSKILDLESIRHSAIKVTLGFKCDPQLKIQLAEDAEEVGLTLSSYVEELLANVESKNLYIQHLENVETELNQQCIENNELINFYENDLLKKLFKSNKGQTISYLDQENAKQEIKIQTLQDVYTVLIHSFK